MSAKKEHIIIDLCSSSASSSSDAEDDGWNALMDVVLQDTLPPPPPPLVLVPAATPPPNDEPEDPNEDSMEMEFTSVKLETTTTTKRKRSHKDEDDEVEEEPMTHVPGKRARSKSLPSPPTTNISPAVVIPQIVQRQSTPKQAFVLPLEDRLNPDSLRAIISMLSGEEDISARGRLKQTCKYLNTFISQNQPFYKHAMIPIYSQNIYMSLVPFDLQNADDSGQQQSITDKEFLYFLVATGHLSSTHMVDTLLAETCITEEEEEMEPEEIGSRLRQRHEPIRNFLRLDEHWFTCPPIDMSAPNNDFGYLLLLLSSSSSLFVHSRLSLMVKGRSVPFGSVKVPSFAYPTFSPFSTFRNDAIFQFSAAVCKATDPHSTIEVEYRVAMNVGQYDALNSSLMFSLPVGEQRMLKERLIFMHVVRMSKFFQREGLRSYSAVNERASFFPTTTSMSTMLPTYPLMASPAGLNFVLNDYQCEAISWMHHLEQQLKKKENINYIAELPHFFGPMHRQGISISPAFLKECAATAYHLLLTESRLDLVERDQLESNVAYQRTFTCKGGLLADATGLGKTVTVLGHIANNLPDEPQHLKAHSLLRFQSRASLVVVPNSIAAQWHNEAQRFAGGKMKIIYLSKKLDLAKVTHEQVMKAGLIIATAEFLERNLFFGGRDFNSRDAQRRRQMQQCELSLVDEERFLGERAACLELFKYERIILDEAHILLDYQKYTTLWKPLSILHGKSYWAVTATPPTTLDLLFPFLQFLRVRPRIYADTNTSFESVMHRTLVTDVKGPKTRLTSVKADAVDALGFRFEFQAMMRAFVRTSFWRNTQSNVAHFEDEHFKIPVARQRIFTVTLSPEEDMFVKAFTLMEANLDLLNECNSFGRVWEVTRTLLFFKKHERNVYLTCSRLTMATAGFSASPWTEDDESHTSRALGENWSPLIHNLYDLGKRIWYAMYTLPLPELQKALDDLEIRLSISHEKVRLNPRNSSALFKWIHTNDERNRCKKLLERMTSFQATGMQLEKTLIKAALDLDRHVIIKKTPFQLACAKYGTKAASVVQYLQTLYSTPKREETRVLLFSQYTETLENFQSLMTYLHVSASLVVGHVDRKTKAIREFNTGQIQALLIPVDKNAAGLHLVAASHVILLDPIMDANGAATELQAIARAIRRGQTKPVEVVRFVVRDTREYEMVQKTLVATSLCEEVAYSPTCV